MARPNDRSARSNGTVTRIVGDKGFGFIRDESGVEYFFHRSACQECDITDLKEGSLVSFEKSQAQKGPRAEQVQRR